jgi:membrane protease YdiL (CAAX protease family)
VGKALHNGKSEDIDQNTDKQTDKQVKDLNQSQDSQTIICPKCESHTILMENPNFCKTCSYRFPRDRDGKIIYDKNGVVVGAYQSAPNGPQIDNFGQGHQSQPTYNAPIYPQSPAYSPQPLYSSHPNQMYPPPNQMYPPPNQMYPPPNQMYPPMYGVPFKKPKTWSIGAGFAVPLCAMLGMVILAIPLTMVFGGLTADPVGNVWFTFLVGALSLIFLILPLMWVQRYYKQKMSNKKRFEELGFPLDKYSRKELIREILLGTLFGILGVFLVWGLQFIANYLVYWIFGVNITGLMESGGVDEYDLLSPDTSLELILFVLMIFLFVGLPEEILFRGFVQRSFETKLKRPSATLLTAIYFTIFHIFIYFLIPAIFLFLFIPYLGISLFLGLIRNWRKDIYAAVVAHIVYDIILTIVIYSILV